MRLSTLLSTILLGFTACMPPQDHAPASLLRSGAWHAELGLGGHALPFGLELTEEAGHTKALIRNGAERMELGEVVLSGDSITIRSVLYEPVFRGTLHGDSLIDGMWSCTSRGEPYFVPFIMRAGTLSRFPGADANAMTVAGMWEVHFGASDTTAGEPATGLFEAHDGIVTGTFATETGDYRFLEGGVRHDSLFLSGFDGGHAYLFEAAVRNDSLLGNFFSGPRYREPWVGVRNPAWHLRDPDSLSHIAADQPKIDLRLATIDGDSVSTAAEAQAGHVVILQVMGSWCANCMDESKLFNELYARHKTEGLRVVALGFERSDDPVASQASLQRFRDKLGIAYPVVHAGRASAQQVKERLPFLEDFMSYPTSIVLDKSGKVRRVHTGFYGPGTGAHYLQFKEEFEGFLKGLLEVRQGAVTMRR